MNKNQYRLVFSRIRRMLIAVEETACSSRKTSHGETAGVVKPQREAVRFALRHAAFAVLLAAGAVPLWAQAQVVGAGGVRRRSFRLRTACRRSISTSPAEPVFR